MRKNEQKNKKNDRKIVRLEETRLKRGKSTVGMSDQAIQVYGHKISEKLKKW